LKNELTCPSHGPNGVGKSTLIKAILWSTETLDGELTLKTRENISKFFSNADFPTALSVVLFRTKYFPPGIYLGHLVAWANSSHTRVEQGELEFARS